MAGRLSARSSEVSVTSTESYWKKARLSCGPSILKTAGAEHLRPKKRKVAVADSNSKRGAAFLTSVLEIEKDVAQPPFRPFWQHDKQCHGLNRDRPAA